MSEFLSNVAPVLVFLGAIVVAYILVDLALSLADDIQAERDKVFLESQKKKKKK